MSDKTKPNKDITKTVQDALNKSKSPFIKALHTKGEPLISSADYGKTRYSIGNVLLANGARIPFQVKGFFRFKKSMEDLIATLPADYTAIKDAVYREAMKVSAGEQRNPQDMLFKVFSDTLKAEINNALREAGFDQLVWDEDFVNNAGIDSKAFVVFDFAEHFPNQEQVARVEARNQQRKANRMAQRAQVDVRTPAGAGSGNF